VIEYLITPPSPGPALLASGSPPFAADTVSVSTGTLVLIGVLLLVEIGLLVAALVDLLRRPDAAVTGGRRWVWILVIVLLNTIGPIVYFVAGRRPRPIADPARSGAHGAATAPPQAPASPDARVDRTIDLLYGSGETPAETPPGARETDRPAGPPPAHDDRA
jgi:hypothetical protein